MSEKKILDFWSLAEQHSYELVELNTNNEHPLLGQISRFKQPVMDGMSCLISFCV